MTGALRWNRETFREIWSLSWPTMLEQLTQTAVQYVDTAMVGTLGTAAVAAVGATSTVGWLIGSTLSALGVGMLAYIARAIGAGEEERVRRASAQAVLVTLAAGILFTILTLSVGGVLPQWMQVEKEIRPLAGLYFRILYLPMLPRAASILFATVLRASGDTRTPMRIGIGVNLVNIVGNFFLIYPTRTVTLGALTLSVPGMDLGGVGAGIASAVAFTVGGIAMTAVLWRHPLLSPRGQKLKPELSILRPFMRVALPNMLQRFGTSLGYVAFASMVNALGDTATAAHTIANTVESAFYIPGWGMQTAAATLAGNAYGARDREKMRSLSALFLPLEVGLMILSGGLLFALAPTLVGIFSRDGAVIALGGTVLRMVALSEPFYGVAIITEGMMQGVGQTRRPFVYNLMGMWGVRIVGTFVCTRYFGLGLESAWGCMIAHNLLLCFLFLITFIRGRWNPLERQGKT